MKEYKGEATLLHAHGTAYCSHVELEASEQAWWGVASSVVLPQSGEATIVFPNGVRGEVLIKSHLVRDGIAIAVNGLGEIPQW